MTGWPPFDGLNSFGFDDFDDSFDVKRTVDYGAHFDVGGDGVGVLLSVVAPR